MKLRTVLNGIAALAVIGVFYTFSFCMVDDIDTTEISKDYYYNTATDTEISMQTDTINEIAETTFDTIKEAADMPSDFDADRVIAQMEAALSYQDIADSAAVQLLGEAVITPLTDPDAAVTTAVPESEEEEDSTESAGADNAPNEEENIEINTPETQDKDNDLIQSENHLEAAVDRQEALADDESDSTDLLSELDRKPTPEEIKETLNKMQEAADKEENAETTAYTAPEDGFITSSGTFFETTGSFVETEQTDITTISPSGAEIFTAKVDGVVQEFDAYQLVCMIVSTEMSPSFSTEALKAQAVAAYSYVKYHNVNGLVPTVLVKRQIPAEVSAAVSSVWGKCCYYDGKVAQTVYTASSAGYTASAENVWGGSSVPYLKSVETPFDAVSDPNYGVITTFSKDYVKGALESYLGITLSDNPESWFSVTSRVDGNYVKTVIIDNQVAISGRKIREGVFKYKLKSWCFDVTYADGEFTFITYGYGHGVGMSQNGANILGKQGYTYDQILTFYFPGVYVS